MTPEELKKIALESTKKEYEMIMLEMEKAAKAGSFSCTFESITDGASEQLTNAGFIVQRKSHYNRSTFGTTSKDYYEVKYSE